MYLSVLNDCLFPARWEGWSWGGGVIASSCFSWTFSFCWPAVLKLACLPKHLPSLKFLHCLMCNQDEL